MQLWSRFLDGGEAKSGYYPSAVHKLMNDQYNVKYIGLFGSYIRGEQTPESDLDIQVEFSKTPTLFKFINLENYLSDNLGIKVGLVVN